MMIGGIGDFLRRHLPKIGNQLSDTAYSDEIDELRNRAAKLLARPVTPRRQPFAPVARNGHSLPH